MRVRTQDQAYRSLARAVVMRAALDYMMLRFPRSSRRELLLWFHSQGRPRAAGGLAPTESEYKAWQRRQVAALGLFFDDRGEDLAKATGCYEVIEKAYGRIDSNRMWVMLNRNRPGGVKHWRWQKADV